MKKCKGLFVTLFLLITVCLFTSCSKENKMEFSNMSGTSFYDCDIWFWNSEDPSDGAIGYENAGNVLMGETGEVTKLGEYCNVNAKDASGRMVMSKIMKAYDGMKIYKSDLF